MKKNKKTIALALAFVAALLFSSGFSMIISLSDNRNPLDITTVVFGITNLLSVLSIGYLFIKILSSNEKKSIAQLKKRLIPSFVFSLFATVFIALSFYYLANYAIFRIKGWDMENFTSRIGPGAIISLSVGLFVCCIVFFYSAWRQAIDREQKLREENLKYQYRTLKTQVNPHFLFNSLNTLSELVYVDAKRADNYIQKLAEIYRYILDNEETEFVRLSKEIEFVQHYFELQKERNDNKILLNLDIKNADKFKVIPVSLQILVENAIKHNSASTEKPLLIQIRDETGYIVVANNIQRKNILNNSSGSGLPNLKERVKLITGKEIVIDQENNQFVVKIPLVQL